MAKKKKKGKRGVLAFMILVGSIFFSSYMIILCTMMLPSLAAWVGDRDKSKRMSVTVGAMNLTGTLPVLISLYNHGDQVSRALKEISDPFNWIIVSLATLVGWVMAQVIPRVIVGVLATKDRMKLDKIRGYQKELVQEWGSEVTEIANLNRDS